MENANQYGAGVMNTRTWNILDILLSQSFVNGWVGLGACLSLRDLARCVGTSRRARTLLLKIMQVENDGSEAQQLWDDYELYVREKAYEDHMAEMIEFHGY